MQYTVYLRWGIITGLFLIPFISLIVADGRIFPSMFFPYITGKNFAFRILVEILLGLYVLLALRDPKYRPRSSLLCWAILGFIAWMGLSTLLSVDPSKSFWSNFERMEGYLSLLHLFLYFIIAGAVLTVDKLWDRFFQTSIGASLLQGFLALFQVVGWFGLSPSSQSGARADGTFGNATYLAVFLLVNLFLTLYMIVKFYGEERRSSSWLLSFYGVALVLQTLGVFLTQTRGAMLGLVAGIIVAVLYFLWQARGPQWQLLRKVSFGVLGTVILLAGVVFVFRNTAVVEEIPGIGRLATISLQETTVVSRLNFIWPMAFKGSLERPITGWGQENFNFVFNKYYQPGMYNQEEWFDRAHNQFLDWFIAGGVPAFLLYLSFYLLMAWAIYRSSLKIPEQAVLLGFLAAYGFHNSFVFDNLVSAIYFFTFLAFTHALSREELPQWMFLSKPLGDRALAIAAPLVLVVTVVVIYQFNAQGLARAQTLLRAIQPSSNLENNLTAFEGALAMGPLGKQETIEQLLQFAAQVAPSAEVSPELKQRAYGLAHTAGEELIAGRSGDARIELIFASFLGQYGQLDEALKHLETAHELSPLKQRVFFQTGSLYLQGGDVAQAISSFKQAFELEPRYDFARVLYASSLYYAGQGATADALLEERYGTVLVDDQRILQTYIDLKQYDRAIGIWQMRAEKNPEDAQTHIGLATVYFTSGNNEGAISELEIAARLDPTLASQIRSVITQIENGTLKP